MAAVDDEHFKLFAGVLEREIARYGTVDDWFARQKKQVEDLIALEVEFRRRIVKSPSFGPYYYRRFIEYICDEQKNILDARPYFRERQGVFAKDISKALKARNYKALYKFGINYRFVMFVMGQPHWGKVGRLRDLSDAITKLRKEIVVMNLPLAINRAQLFYSRTPKSHLARMDFVGIATEGLLSGIDKYAPEKKAGVVTRQFRSTAVGRMGGNFIEEYSETLVHFYPVDKRKIYRANKLLSRNVGPVDFEKLAVGVNEAVQKAKEEKTGIVEEEVKENEHPTTPDEIADLMAAASTVSSDSSLPSDPDAPEPIERFAAPEATRPDTEFELREVYGAMLAAIPDLTVFQRKLLRLKGLRF